MSYEISSRIPAETVRRWALRAFFVGLALGVVAAIVALLS
jgi:Mg/Co/Ni transporter MgtE